MNPLELLKKRNEAGITSNQEIMLAFIAAQECNVGDVLAGAQALKLGSQATVHRDIHNLVKTKLITLVTSKKDGRNKFTKLTPKGVKYLSDYKS